MISVALGGTLACLLICLAWIDARTGRLPNALNSAVLITGLLQIALFGQPSWLDGILGTVGGGISFATISLVYKALRGLEGLGLGDAKLIAAAGTWIGWTGIPLVVLIGSLVALVYVAVRAAMGDELKSQQTIPFGPFLCLGIFTVWCLPFMANYA